jgi:hypothetical protein
VNIPGGDMKIAFTDIGENVEFRITDFDPKYIPVFEMCFYHHDENGYYKLFSLSTRNLDEIKANYQRDAATMFNQLGYFEPIPWEEALEEFCSRVHASGIRWWLTGSCAACLRGIALNPHDVDIMIDSRDKERIAELFHDCLIEPIVDTNGWVTKDFGVLFKHARIDIASDPSPVLDNPQPVDCGPYALANLETINWRGYEIKIPPLHLQEYVNELRNRSERVKLIREFRERNGL